MKPASTNSTSREEATKAGNYFVSNYPPYSFWKSEHVPAVARVLAEAAPAGVPLGIYVHIPFCRQRCDFCYFKVYTDKSSKEIRRYLAGLRRELALYAPHARFRGRKPRFVYFGGGTPSYLSAEQLRELFESVRTAFPWDEVQEVAFECEPGTLSEVKLAELARLGVTRLSLGVENFDSHILEINNRAHRAAEIQRTYDHARAVGFEQINIDLIAGMVGETDQNWRDCVRRAAELDPESITIYQMELPYNTEFSKEILKAGGPSRVAGWDRKRAWVEEAFDTLEKAGYRAASGYTLVRAGSPGSFVYRDALWRGSDMIGTGVASFSHVGGVHFQNADRFEDYLARVGKGELPLSRALPTRPQDRLVREMILQLKLGAIDAGDFRRKFGVEVLERFAEAYRGLREEGLLDWQGDRITLTRKGLLRVDELLSRFFLPEHRGARYT
jgi:oxygen-independent coproporphyrinogen-3 oxidase